MEDSSMSTKSSNHYNFHPLRFSLPPKKIDDEERRSMIARAAYFRAQRRNFEAGHELEDWLAAELEVDRDLARQHPKAPT